MRRLYKIITALISASCLMAGTANASLITSTSNNPLTFSWSYNTIAGALKGNGSMSVSGLNSSLLTLAVTLNNTSSLSANRLKAFGFGISPNFVDPPGSSNGVTFGDADTTGIVSAVPAGFSSISGVEICAFGGSSCSSNSGGISGGSSDSFTIALNGIWGRSIDIDPIAFKYQTGSGSYEFKSGPSSGCMDRKSGDDYDDEDEDEHEDSHPPNVCATTTSVPEPASLPLMALGLLGLLGTLLLGRRIVLA